MDAAVKNFRMLKEPFERLREARVGRGYTSTADFARKFGFSEVTYRSHENGTRGLTLAAARQYGRALQKSWIWLLTGERESLADQQAIVQVASYVGAGEQVFPLGEDGQDMIEAPPGLTDGFAVVVRGTSMLPAYRDGDILFAENRQLGPRDIVGRDCVVQIHDGPRQVKRVVGGRKRGMFRLFSYASLTETGDLKLDWAAPIKWVKRA